MSEVHVHRWERWVWSLICDCPQCAGEERYVVCDDCGSRVNEKEPEFETLWEVATSP